MLILSRKVGERIIIGDNITIVVHRIDITNGQVKIGIIAPRDMPVHREEIANEIARLKQEQDTN